MKITIVGAGIIGSNLAKDLSDQNHEVYVVEKNPEIAAKANEKLDAKVIVGEGSDPEILKQAGVESADLVIAVTASDETNFVVCSLADAYGAKKKIARIRNLPLSQALNKFGYSRFSIDEIINPEQVAAEQTVKIVMAPGSHEVADFGDGKILLRSFVVLENSPLCNAKIEDFRNDDSPWPFLIIAVKRDNSVVIPKGDIVIQKADRIYVLLPAASLGEFLAFVNPDARRAEKVVIYGATSIGERIAQDLVGHVRDILILEENEEEALEAAGKLTNVRVINGSPSEKELLKECGMEAVDVFISASENDHSNLVSAVLAKKAGAKKTIIITQQPDYMTIMESLEIDVMINPRFLAVDQILRLVRGDGVNAVTKIVGCNAEALELVPEQGSPITKAPLKDVKFPKDSIIGAVFRDDDVLLADGNTHIREGEGTIVFCHEKCIVPLQKLFTRKKIF
ncbi:MAG: Trk system potassium transporter TrkA [Candidatus Omnitrophica bacterium]|nr:Trk system potassium transporter TrkA [Candidatus Omnitrophota bacterium]